MVSCLPTFTSRMCGVSSYKLVLLSGDVWHIHVVGRWGQVLQLLASEDINGDQVDLGVTVLAGLRGRHVDNLAWAVLNHNVAVLPQCRALHGERGGGASIGAVEGVLMLWGKIIESAIYRARAHFCFRYGAGRCEPPQKVSGFVGRCCAERCT